MKNWIQILSLSVLKSAQATVPSENYKIQQGEGVLKRVFINSTGDEEVKD